MCRYFENSQEFPQEFFQRNTFIELGSGIGLLGIAFATVGSSITLTDQGKELLRIVFCSLAAIVMVASSKSKNDITPKTECTHQY